MDFGNILAVYKESFAGVSGTCIPSLYITFKKAIGNAGPASMGAKRSFDVIP